MSAHKNWKRARIAQLRRGKELCASTYYGKLDLLRTKEQCGINDEGLRKRVLQLKLLMKNRGAL